MSKLFCLDFVSTFCMNICMLSMCTYLDNSVCMYMDCQPGQRAGKQVKLFKMLGWKCFVWISGFWKATNKYLVDGICKTDNQLTEQICTIEIHKVL